MIILNILLEILHENINGSDHRDFPDKSNPSDTNPWNDFMNNAYFSTPQTY